MIKSKSTKSKPKKVSIPILQQLLDKIFSVYIRLRHANQFGFCKCITCGEMLSWVRIQNGHYIDRRHIATRYDERNCHPQCPRCNIGSRGNHEKYKRAIVAEYGVKVLEELESGKRSIEKLTVADYQDKIAYYKAEVKRLKKEKGL
ncbi:recombination protein NinG [Parabacteroides sp.]